MSSRNTSLPRRILLLLVTTALLALGLVIQPISPAGATLAPSEDRLIATPTSWWTYTGVSASTINSLLSSNGARLTDLRVQSVDSGGVPTFTAVMVKNAGTYSSGFWWYYGQSQAQVTRLLSANHARLTMAQAYSTPSGRRFAVVMVPNSGANAKTWWWYIGTPSFLASKITANNARLISFSHTDVAGQYLGIMVHNTGVDAKTWWWYHGESISQISSLLTKNHARIVDLDRNSSGTYNVLMYANPSTRWYWYVGQNLSTAVSRALQQGERVIDVTPYSISGTTRYAVVTTQNLSGSNERLWDIIGPKVDSGAYGFFLKQVGGSVKDALNQSTQYEPASALKVLYHAWSIHEEAASVTSDLDTVTYHYNPADPTNAGICPDDFANTNTTTLQNADTKMMQNSDNRMTRGILDKYTKSAVLNYASSLGLTATEIHHNIGCPTSTTHNWTTLSDLGKIYEAFQNGTVTNSGPWQTQFRSRMLNGSNYSGFRSLICPIVTQEAASLGKSSAVASAFCNRLAFIAKGGDYAYGGSYPRNESHDDFWLVTMPYKAGGASAPKYFLLGEYVDEVQINSTTEINKLTSARSKLKQEALRPYIRAALMTW